MRRVGGRFDTGVLLFSHMEPQINESQSVIAPLKKVTPVSKYLAMALFIILPFLGAWIGYISGKEDSNDKSDYISESIKQQKFIDFLPTAIGPETVGLVGIIDNEYGESLVFTPSINEPFMPVVELPMFGGYTHPDVGIFNNEFIAFNNSGFPSLIRVSALSGDIKTVPLETLSGKRVDSFLIKEGGLYFLVNDVGSMCIDAPSLLCDSDLYLFDLESETLSLLATGTIAGTIYGYSTSDQSLYMGKFHGDGSCRLAKVVKYDGKNIVPVLDESGCDEEELKGYNLAMSALKAAVDKKQEPFFIVRLNRGIVSPTNLDASDFMYLENGKWQKISSAFDSFDRYSFIEIASEE